MYIAASPMIGPMYDTIMVKIIVSHYVWNTTMKTRVIDYGCLTIGLLEVTVSTHRHQGHSQS